MIGWYHSTVGPDTHRCSSGDRHALLQVAEDGTNDTVLAHRYAAGRCWCRRSGLGDADTDAPALVG